MCCKFHHTFCTNTANAGMDVKDLQYLMGHSDAGITMNTYTHASYEHAEKAMLSILKPKGEDGGRRRRDKLFIVLF